MPKVALTGWLPGFQAVPAIKLLRRSCGLGLKPAKEMIENLLDGERLYFSFDTEQAADEFAEAALDLDATIEYPYLDPADRRAPETALRRLSELFAMPLFELNSTLLTGDLKEAERHFSDWDPNDPIGLEAFVNHYHLEDYIRELGLDPKKERRELNRLADALVLVWLERLTGILGERTLLFYVGGEQDVIVRFHVERPGSVPWMNLDPAFIKKARMRIFRASRSGLERIA
ncbi:MAG: hypothetical protein ABJC13_19440 [Acidobacteriota bacterium]